MFKVNPHYSKLKAGYLFPEIARRVSAFVDANEKHLEDKPIIKLGIGDVTEPLPEACRTAMIRAVNEMGKAESFRGYGPEQGYAFLREKIAEHDYQSRDCDISADEIFVSDGSKCDTGNILNILAPTGGNTVAVCDPVYPVYVDTNVMAGNTGEADDSGAYAGLRYLPMAAENDFVPAIPDEPVDVIYLCYPNNPTGAVADRETLKAWVDYANTHGSLLLFDAAYEAFITGTTIPRSIYEIEGARTCAIEFRSFSKNAGFTGTRCAWTVVPKQLVGAGADGKPTNLHSLWSRRHSTLFNGVSYIIQRGAEAVYSEAGQEQIQQLVKGYLANAKIIREGLTKAGLQVYGGVHAPYVWVATPGGTSSWAFFDQLLEQTHVVGTPGSGFGAAGEGYFRLSAFNSKANVEQAVARIVENKALVNV